MARHSSFKVLIAHETYQKIFATICARELAERWAAENKPPSQTMGRTADSGLPFSSAGSLPADQLKSESWIESWLAGKTSGPAR